MNGKSKSRNLNVFLTNSVRHLPTKTLFMNQSKGKYKPMQTVQAQKQKVLPIKK